jgi:hypothetical protein
VTEHEREEEAEVIDVPFQTVAFSRSGFRALLISVAIVLLVVGAIVWNLWWWA